MNTELSVKRALTRWLVLQRAGKAHSTKRYYRETVKQIRRHWRDVLPKPAASITPDDVYRFHLRAARYSPTRWNSMVMVLKATIPAATDLKRQPVKLTRPPPPTQQEFARLVDECDRRARSHARLVVDFLAHSGLRITAARSVTWATVHPDRIEYTGKGNRLCSVPIIPGMAAILDKLKELGDGSGYVLPRAMIRKGLKIACDRAGLRRLTHHDFRHLFITRCIESGVDVPTVARWVGHGDGGALLSKRYFHLLDGHSREMAARVRI
jgi:integrase